MINCKENSFKALQYFFPIHRMHLRAVERKTSYRYLLKIAFEQNPAIFSVRLEEKTGQF